MSLLLTFASALLVAVYVSRVAHRTVLSTAVLFLFAGFFLGGVLKILPVQRDDDLVRRLAEFALFSVLFTDGMRAGTGGDRSDWTLAARALAIGMPVTIVLTAVAARATTGLPWPECFLVSAALSPTDPVFAAAIVGRDEVPRRVRRLLNLESGLNDGLALPVVVLLLAVVSAADADAVGLIADVAGGIALGLAVPYLAIVPARRMKIAPSSFYEPLHAIAIGLLVLAVASLTGVNEFLAAFTAGITVAVVAPNVRAAFHDIGERVTELLKLAAILVFGALISPQLLTAGVAPYVFAAAALLVARPAALLPALARSRLDRREWLTTAWFGPKGFASVVYGLLIAHAAGPHAVEMFHVIALVVVLSVVAHSSTDVLIARWFTRVEDATRS